MRTRRAIPTALFRIKDIDRATLQIDSKAGHANFVTDIDGNALAYDRKSSILARNKAARPIE